MRFNLKGGLVTVAIAMCSQCVLAQDEEASADRRWSGKGELGLVKTTGNSETESFLLGLEFVRETGVRESLEHQMSPAPQHEVRLYLALQTTVAVVGDHDDVGAVLVGIIHEIAHGHVELVETIGRHFGPAGVVAASSGIVNCRLS